MKECCVYEYELDEWNIIFWIMYCFFFYGVRYVVFFFFFFQAEDGIRDGRVTGVQTCALPIYRALTAGARGYLSKETDRAEICDAITAALEATLVVRLSTAMDGHGTYGRSRPTFTPREAQVVALTAEGLSAPQIATALGIGTTTVKTHLERVYGKLDVTDRAAMVATAIRLGLLT